MENFKIGQHIVFPDMRKPRNIRQMKINKNGELLLGIGRKTIGWLFAKDCMTVKAAKEKHHEHAR